MLRRWTGRLIRWGLIAGALFGGFVLWMNMWAVPMLESERWLNIEPPYPAGLSAWSPPMKDDVDPLHIEGRFHDGDFDQHATLRERQFLFDITFHFARYHERPDYRRLMRSDVDYHTWQIAAVAVALAGVFIGAVGWQIVVVRRGRISKTGEPTPEGSAI